MLVLIAYVAFQAAFDTFRVEGRSMRATLEDGDLVLVNELAYQRFDVTYFRWLPFVDSDERDWRYLTGGPGRGDLVVFRDPRNETADLVKRVIGMPGETVTIDAGRVLINGRALDEPYIATPWFDTRGPVEVPAGHYFLMGDNRSGSLDSRVFGPVPGERIVGRVVATYWPLANFDLRFGRPSLGAVVEGFD